MNQADLDRAVARVTGESRRTIARIGFHLQHDRPASSDALCLVLVCPGCGAVVGVSPTAASRDAECARCDAVYPYADDEVSVAPHAALGILP